jgi:heme exporter protein CcmD
MTPQFVSVTEFLAMGGYPGFVFGAWGLSLAVVAALIVRAILTGQHEKARLEALRQKKDASANP